MHNQQQGFIFLFTLCFISLISLFLLTSMQHVLLYYKAINRQEVQHQQFYHLEHKIGALMHHPLNPECIQKSDEAHYILKQLQMHKGCFETEGSYNYQYLIEDLGLFPCLLVKKKKHLWATRHFRISLVVNELTTSALQIRVIQPTSDASFCSDESKVVKEGISSWHYVQLKSNP